MSNIVYNSSLSSCTYDLTKPEEFSFIGPDYLGDSNIPLNNQILYDRYSTDFTPVLGSNDSTSCSNLRWVSPDPRLISPVHGGQVLSLDRPPTTSSVKLDMIAMDSSLDGYGQYYNSYKDINYGDIIYNSHSNENPFFVPIFTLPSIFNSTLFIDPMGGVKPQYNRNPIIKKNYIGPVRNNYVGGLSWIEDSMSHREDLIASQMSRSNQERWSPKL
jgi:hypothetical protein